MKTLHRYLLRNFFVTFAMALAVLTFVMSIGLVFGVMKYIARGMPLPLVLDSLLRSLPGTLSYSVPVASLVASLLVFSRLSSDSEISAMRSCGVSLFAIMRAPLLLSLLLTFVCLWVNDDVSPDSSYSRQRRRRDVKATDALALLEPDEWVEIDDARVFVADRHGNELEDIQVMRRLEDGSPQKIRAARARILESEGKAPVLVLQHVALDPISVSRPGVTQAEEFTLPLSALSGRTDVVPEPGSQIRIRRRTKDLHTWELLRDIAMEDVDVPADPKAPGAKERARALSRAKAEVATRVALAAACICFVLVGIPLGIQSHRRQSSAGLAVSLAVAGAFYLFCITGQSLAKHPGFHAHWIVLAPVGVCIVLAAFLVSRNN